MKTRNLLTLLILITILSCTIDKKNKKSKEIENLSTEKYFNAKDEVLVFDSISMSIPSQNDSLADWKGYQKVKEGLLKFKKTTPNEVLVGAEEFVGNVKVMNDSITISLLDERSLKARINALYNQSLRLQEMKDIPSITVEEIEKQTKGLFSIFRMINHKIDAIYKQEEFEKELLEDDFFFSKMDSI